MSKKIDWPTAIFIITYHIALFVVLPFYFYYHTPSWGIITITVLLYFMSGISITSGYHRLYSHRTYKANKIVEFTLLFLATLAGQGSALRWSFDHRQHHAYVDTDDDPYSIKKGFLYAHILWLFEKRRPINDRVVNDLLQNKLVAWQHKYYGALFVATNFILFLCVGMLCNDYLSSFILVWWTRLFLLHHSTWFINSLAHFCGSRTYCKELSAVDNYLISLVTFGEGYHNYHHTFATDYRNGIRWYHFDPTKWMIWGLSKVGLTRDLKVIDTYKIRKCIVKKDADLMLRWIEKITYIKTEVLEQKIQETSDKISEQISHMNNLLNEYNESRKNKVEKQILKSLRREIKIMRKDLAQDWKDWLRLCKQILKLKATI